MQETDSRNRWPWIAWALLAIPGLTFLALASFDHPFADDFIYAAHVRDMGFGPMQQHLYRHWTGRYTATALQSGVPWAFGLLRAYPAIPWVVIPAWWLSLGCFLVSVNRSLGSPISRAGVWLATFVLGSIYFAEMPSPSEGFYWLSAVATYTVPQTTALLMLSCALAVRRDSSPTVIVLASMGAWLLAMVTAGGNESLLPVLLLSLFVAGVFAVRSRHPSAWVWFAAWTGIAIGTAIVVLSPGNAIRVTQFHKSPFLAFLKVQPHLWKWFVLSPAILGILILAIPLAARIADRMPWTWRITGARVVLAAVAGWCLVLLSVLSPISMGLGPPNRVLNQSYLIFLLSCCVTACCALAWFRNRRNTIPYTSARARGFGWAMLVLGLLVVSNVPRAVYDLAFVVVPYDRELRARYEQLTHCAATAAPEVVVDRLANWPQSIRPGNLNDERSTTTMMGLYFGLAKPDFKIR